MKNKVNRNDGLKSYLVDADTFSELGEPVHITGVIAPEKCQRYANPNHKMCEGRGILNFDDGRVFFDTENKRQVLTKWRRTCDCVSRKLEKNPSLIG